MRLERYAKTSMWGLHVDRGEADITQLVQEHGLDFSESGSTPERALLIPRNDYAALTYYDVGSPLARQRLAVLQTELRRSSSLGSGSHLRTQESRSGLEFQPFQRAGVDYALGRQDTLIGDEPGCTKTAQAIAVANEIKAARVLVVCPASIRLQWADAIRDWTLIDRVRVWPVMRGKDGLDSDAHWNIISYQLLKDPGVQACIQSSHYDLLILDEAHYLKSTDAQRTHLVFADGGVASRADKILALSGTPLPNRPRECYTLSRALCWDAIDWVSEEKFRDRFNPSALIERHDESGNLLASYVKEKVGRLPELQNRLRSNFMVRRALDDIQPQLPKVRFEIKHVEETGAVRTALAAERMLDIDPETFKGIDTKMLGAPSIVRHQMGMAIVPQAVEYIETLLEGGSEKLFVVGWHIGVLDVLETKLRSYGLVRVDGSVPSTQRPKLVSRFAADQSVRIFLGNIQAVGIGTDGLQHACSHVVGVEASWTPGDNEQVVARLRRMGQKFGVLAEWLVAEGSVSERILGSSIRKLHNIHSALDKDHGFELGEDL